LSARRKDLDGREYFKKSKKKWYELWCPRKFDVISGKKIVVPEMADCNRFSVAEDGCLYGDTTCGIILKPSEVYSMPFVLGVLNSKLVEFYYKKSTVPKAGGYYIYKTTYLKSIPIKILDLKSPNEKKKHDKIVQLVETMLELNKQLAKTKTSHGKDLLNRQIEMTDKMIDDLVYELYELTPEEIQIVEDSLKQ